MSRKAVPLRTDYNAVDCRRLARNCKNAREICRLLAIAAVYDGMSRLEAAKVGAMDRQTLRDWVHRFNVHGPEGLIDRWSPGPRCRLSDKQLEALRDIVTKGPDVEIDGVARWRRADLRQVIEKKFKVKYHPHHVSALLHRLGFSHISSRPQHPKQDTQALEAFKKTSQTVWGRP
jgi:transposase